MKQRAFFLTFEGTDGVGKSTHVRLLTRWLEKQGLKVLLTREPGGGKVSEKIRGLLLDPNTKIETKTELLLFQAARVEHTEKIIRPALKTNLCVICDRFIDATIAYQGFARGLSLREINFLNQFSTGGLKPDLTILLDLPAHVGLQKAKSRNQKQRGDRLENEGILFQKKVRKGYLYLARKYPGRIHVVQVKKDINETQTKIREIVTRYFKK